jgi:NAD(P)H-hydrate epimerase
MGGPDAVRPRWTVALTALKDGMTSENSGEISIRDIGIPAEAWQRTGPGEFLRFPTAGDRGARGRNGRVLVIAGGPYSGAPALAGLAALRSGAERATIAAPAPAADAVRAFSPDLVVHQVGTEAFSPADLSQLGRILDEGRVSSIVLGMGTGRSEETLEMFRRFLAERRGRLPMVVDADALAALTPTPGGSDRTVATPNEGEYERVFGRDPSATWPDRLGAARRHAMTWGLTLLAKGEADRITDGRREYLNFHHHPAATVSGVGDVLAGVVGGLLAQGLTTTDAALLGSYWVGEAGTIAAEARGYSLLATDVIDALSPALVAGIARVRS